MNIKTIDKCVNPISHTVPKLAVDGSNASGFYKADILSLDGKEFKNYGGYPRNEVAVINEQQNEVVARALADRLVQVPDDSRTVEQVSDTDLMLMAKSKYMQTPSEIIAHNERILQIRDERIAERKRLTEERIKQQKDAKAKQDFWNSLSSEEKEKYYAKKREKEINDFLSNE